VCFTEKEHSFLTALTERILKKKPAKIIKKPEKSIFEH